MQIRDRTFLVTGASRGIGADLAALLLEDGANVVLAARTLPALPDGGARSVALQGDVCEDTDVARMVAAAEERFGRLDVVVNNAAVLTQPARIVDTPPETWRHVLDVNVVGTANVIRYAVPALQRAGGGIVINLSSTWGRSAAARQAPYCASKFAVEALTSSLAGELPPGIVAVAINPGVIATDMLATAFEGDVSAFPGPRSLRPHWRALFAGIDGGWSGRSFDLDALA